MDEVNFLNKLSEYGIQNDYFSFIEIGKLDKSCCAALTLEVIDFDKTEEVHRVKHNYQVLKSCDALKFTHNTPSIDFIEMKGLRKFIQYQLDVNNNIPNQVQNKAVTFKFINKIRDSITILNNIVQSHAFDISGSERNLYQSFRKKYIVLTDVDPITNPIEAISLTLEFLGQASSDIENIVYESLEEHIDNLDVANYYNIERPILLSCADFESYYSTL